MKKTSFWSLLKKVHACEAGSVSLETVLVVGAIALPILIFLIYVAWPQIKTFFNAGMDQVEAGPGTIEAH